ncbi:leukocyte elastase inhibitor isoform X2 [Prorops nasuta]|uniref:leukocyte elastase inhibitor isoform X2 n=1 Tax=Prorops nasuta TaxID=863751 RepID=UPI0034CEA386
MYSILVASLLTVVGAQILYPDDFERMKSTIEATQRIKPNPIPQSYPSSIPTMYPSSYPIAPYAGGPLHAKQASNVSPIFLVTTTAKPASNALGSAFQSVLPERWSNHVNNLISRGIMKFAIDIDNAIVNMKERLTPGNTENVVFSPLSLAGTMAMVLLGSAGTTFLQVARILGLEAGVDISRHSEVVHQMFGLLLDGVQVSPNSTVRVHVASAIFVQEGYPIRPEFKAVSEKVYKSETINLDFMNRAAEAQEKVNAWVRQRTYQKINGILSEPPRYDTKVIIASALYFLGEWTQHFIEGATKRKPFYVEPGQSIDVDMMYNGGRFAFYIDPVLDAKIVALPYKGDTTTMYVVLPNAVGATALKNFQRNLSAESLETMIGKMQVNSCIIGMPKMKLSSSLKLNEALQALGLTSLFNPAEADLSILSSGYVPPAGGAPVTSAQPQSSNTRYTGSPLPRRNDNNDILIFSRFNPEQQNSEKRNYLRYEEKIGGYAVEQWHNGFMMKKLRRMRRTLPTAEEDNIGFSAKGNAQTRKKRQDRPIDGDFLAFLESQNLPSFGLDNLRNSLTGHPNPRLYADQVLHKVEMDVTETGTEAAAVTTVSLERTGSANTLIANRPFLFFIRHDASKLILFWGTVNRPTPNYPPTTS